MRNSRLSLGIVALLTDTPIIRDHEYHLALKRKVLGLEKKYPPLRRPHKKKGKSAPVLHAGTEKEAGFRAGTAKKLRAICEQWYQESGEPFIVLVARIGQLLLNKGAYGELEFFSPQTFDAILPKSLNRYYPGIEKEWGMGITPMRQRHPDAGKNGLPEDATILSKNVIGHGSATSAILRVDLDNDLVIAQSRRRAGPAYGKYLTRFLLAIQEGLE